MNVINTTLGFIKRQPRWRLAASAAAVVVIGILWISSGRDSVRDVPTFTARRGPLDITVLQGGSLQALESQEIKCEVRVGYQGTKILRIVEEGYLVTEDDVRTNKVLCELDSSDLQKQIVQQEIQYQTAMASLTDAQQNYEIQLGQNDSDVKAAEQKARFARMDFDKFLGDAITEQIIKEVGLDKLLALVSTNDVSATANAQSLEAQRNAAAAVAATDAGNGLSNGNGINHANGNGIVNGNGKTTSIVVADAQEAPMRVGISLVVPPSSDVRNPRTPPTSIGTPLPPEIEEPEPSHLEMPNIKLIDFSKYASLDILGDGEAKQKLRKLDDDLQVAQKELGQAKTALEGTERLFAKGFVPKTEITRDQISFESAQLKVQSAETARALFLKYEFRRTAEESLSKYAEAVRELDKARRVAISKLAQARARLNSSRGQYEVQLRTRKDLLDQLAKCTLTAQKSGLVVYGGGREEYDREPIREGATVRERQSIITIPDMTRMSVTVKVHETYIKKIARGQKANITVDAFPDQRLTGEISKVAVLPDSQNRWMNPDMKVYMTTITIDGTHDWVKPGMSAKVEILVNRLDDVVYIPVHAVTPIDGKQYCYVMNGFKPDRREIEIGEFTDDFIEVRRGVSEGDRVLLRPPTTMELEDIKQEQPAKPDEKEPATLATDSQKSPKT